MLLCPGRARTRRTQKLPPIVVTGTKPGIKRGRAETATRTVRRPTTRVVVYPTTPISGAGINPDKVPASVNLVDANQIKQTGSLNIGDALQKYVPGVVVNEVAGNPFQPNVQFRGFVALSRIRHPAGTGGLPERRAHQRGVRRHRQLGPDSDRRDQIGHRGDQQSRLRPQCAGRGRRCADEGWLQLSRRRDRHDGRLVRAYPEFGAMGQAGRQFCCLRRARRTA